MKNRRIASRSAAVWWLFGVAAVAFSSGASVAGGQAETSSPALPLEGEQVVCELFLVGTDPHGATRELASAGGVTSYVQVGRTGADPVEGLCAGGSGSGPGVFPPEQFKDAAHTWVAKCRVLRAEMDDIELDVEWERLDSVPGGLPERAAGDRRTIRLREDQHHWLDFVDDPAADGFCVRNALVGVRLTVREDPQLADRKIRYDLWFVDEAPDGTRLARHRHVIGAQGKRMAVAFEPLRWRVPGVRFADGDRAEVLAEISAELFGRARRDGNVALILDVSRWLGVVHEGRERKGGVGDGGRKGFRAEPGVSVALELPAPQGGHLAWSTASGDGETYRFYGDVSSPLPPGVSEQNGAVAVNFPQFFRGHTMRLIVTATVE